MAGEDPQFWNSERGRSHRARISFGAGTGLTTTVVALGVATFVGLIVLWPSGSSAKGVPGLDSFKNAYKARLVTATSSPCQGVDPTQETTCVELTATLLEGPDEGTVATLQFPSPAAGTTFASGQEVLLVRFTLGQGGPAQYSYLDRVRLPSLWWLAVIFAVAVVLLGRLHGVGALVGLVVSFFVLLKFILPAIIQGENPMLVALVGSTAIAFFALYLAQGFNRVTTMALLGTIGALVFTAALGAAWVHLSSFTGLGSEEAYVVQLGAAHVDLVGLLLAGIIIGALGALDDMSVTQAAAVDELRKTNPDQSKRSLYRSGIRIGRDHVASIVNTLVLAYAGASLPLLILFLISNQGPGLVLNSEAVAVEIVRALVGSIGLVMCVPLTTWLAAYLMPESRRGRRERTKNPVPAPAHPPSRAADGAG